MYNLLISLHLFRSLLRDLHNHGQDTSASPGSCSHPCGRPDYVSDYSLTFIHNHSFLEPGHAALILNIPGYGTCLKSVNKRTVWSLQESRAAVSHGNGARALPRGGHGVGAAARQVPCLGTRTRAPLQLP